VVDVFKSINVVGGARENINIMERMKVRTVEKTKGTVSGIQQSRKDTLVVAIEKCLKQAHAYLIELEELDESAIKKDNGYLMATSNKTAT
jgi:hypothetical protein